MMDTSCDLLEYYQGIFIHGVNYVNRGSPIRVRNGITNACITTGAPAEICRPSAWIQVKPANVLPGRH